MRLVTHDQPHTVTLSHMFDPVCPEDAGETLDTETPQKDDESVYEYSGWDDRRGHVL